MYGFLTTWLLVVSAKYLTVFVPFLSLCFFDTLGFSDIIFIDGLHRTDTSFRNPSGIYML